MTTYIYEPLDYSQAQIRLLELFPAPEYSDPIRIRVSLHGIVIPPRPPRRWIFRDLKGIDLAFKNPKENPDFFAISYVWGSLDDPGEVIVESAPEGANKISTTRNLDAALRHFRLMTDDPVPIWIDAICIDQGNLEERSHQVAMMGSIYQIAYKTVVWLGPEEENSHRAMKSLEYLGKRVRNSRSTGKLKRHPDAPPRKPNEGILESESEAVRCSVNDLRAVISLLERAWFTRLWVHQEIALSTRAEFLCGTTTMDWVHLHNGASCFCKKPLRRAAADELRERFSRMKTVVTSFIRHMLIGTTYELCRRDFVGIGVTDPRDSIYAIKSLLPEDDQRLDVRPDYTSQTADVFLDVCKRIVERQGLTYFLESCELNSISVPSLPSWVPDWSKSTTTPTNIMEYVYWSASAFISANATYLGDGVLRVAGVQIAKIESIRNLYDLADNELARDWPLSIERVFRYVQDLYPWDTDIDSPYDKNQTMLDAYCRTVNMGRFSDSWDPPDSRSYTFDDAKVGLKRAWSLDAGWTRPEDFRTDDKVYQFLSAYLRYAEGRCFFTTKDGYIGLAPLGTQPGDTVGIILGCRNPMVLRNETTSSTKPDENRWEVVGPGYVNGLMSGEAIYGTFPSHYRAVSYSSSSNAKLTIRGRWNAILDTRTNELKTDPAAILEEFGIQPSVWTQHPHRLEVSETVLREAGIELRDFFLV